MSGSYVNTNASSETFNQQASHDTSLYDPNVHDNQIVALYETDEKARMARDKLIAGGVASHSVRVMDRNSDQMAGGVDYESGNQGIWGAIKSLFMPDEDAHAYSHAIGRGHAMVVVTPAAGMDRHHVIEVLESTDPIDFDAKLEEWRQAGYQGMEATAAAGTANTGMGSTGTGSTGNATVDRAQATPANYAVNQTTVTDNIPADARRTSDMPSGVAGTAAGTAGAVAGGLAAGHGAAAPVTSTAATHTGAGATTGSTMPSTQAGRSTEDVSSPVASDTSDTLKVVREQLRVGKREVPRGAVRIRSYVVERPVEEQVRLHEERVQVERRPVDRPAGEADVAAFQDRTIEVQARGEEAVVGKSARVVEEVGLRKDVAERVETVRDTVRETRVEVEDNLSTTGATGTGTTGTGTTTTGSTTAGTSGSGTMGTGGGTSTATTGATSSGTNAPRK